MKTSTGREDGPAGTKDAEIEAMQPPPLSKGWHCPRASPHWLPMLCSMTLKCLPPWPRSQPCRQQMPLHAAFPPPRQQTVPEVIAFYQPMCLPKMGSKNGASHFRVPPEGTSNIMPLFEGEMHLRQKWLRNGCPISLPVSLPPNFVWSGASGN